MSSVESDQSLTLRILSENQVPTNAQNADTLHSEVDTSTVHMDATQSEEPLTTSRPDHHSANPGRVQLGRVIAEIMRRGYTLTDPEVRQIMPVYGYPKKTSDASGFMCSPGLRKIIKANGVELLRESYKRKTIYRDGNLAREETDIAQAISKIDKDA